MESLAGSWFLILVLSLCVGVHLFGHGHATASDTPNRRGHDLVDPEPLARDHGAAPHDRGATAHNDH